MSEENVNNIVENLHMDTIHVVPVDRDWSEGYTETWDYVEAPSCGECDTACRHIDGPDAIKTAGLNVDELRAERDTLDEREAAYDEDPEAEDTQEPTDAETERRDELSEMLDRLDKIKDETWPTWRCCNGKCDEMGTEVEPHDHGADGPMMNYAYPLPDLGTADDEYDAAMRIRNYPLCIVRDLNGGGFALALTGGGMDLSWDICGAFVALGMLPPVHFASDLPKMAGHTPDPVVLASCRRSVESDGFRALRRVESFRREWGTASEQAGEYTATRLTAVPVGLLEEASDIIRDGLHTQRGAPFTTAYRETVRTRLLDAQNVR
jgi:hypothetical protein